MFKPIEISVLIPVYNVEMYLDECLRSILEQKFSSFEIICVNDGSTDGSGDILKKYAALDHRLKVISQENQGVSRARNRALEEASGEFVCFIDADDYISKETLERVYIVAIAKNADIVVFGGHSFPPTWADDCFPSREAYYENDSIAALLRERGSRPFTFNKLYRRSIIKDNNVLFKEDMKVGEDQLFQFEIFPKAERIAYISDNLYYHRMERTGSAMHSIQRDYSNWVKIHLQLVERCLETLRHKQGYHNDLANWFFPLLYFGVVNAGFSNKVNAARGAIELEKKYVPYARLNTKAKMAKGNMEKWLQRSKRSPKISIIMPVYNAERYLQPAIDSLLRQTFQDFELICIDDGSTDSSPEVLIEYADKDWRIKLLRQSNMYAGVARNHGIKQASGEYLCFLDADDMFDNDMLEKAYAAGSDYTADVVLFGARYLNMSTGQTSDAPWILDLDKIPKLPVFSKEDIPNDLFQITIGTPWGKLFRRDFIKEAGLEFQALRHNNDVYFVELALACANKIVSANKVLMTYRTQECDSLQATRDIEPLNFLYALSAVKEELEKRDLYLKLKKSFTTMVISDCMHNLFTARSKEALFKLYDALIPQGLIALDSWDIPQESLSLPTWRIRQYFKACRLSKEELWKEVESKRSSNRWKIINPASNIDVNNLALLELEHIRKSMSFRIGRTITWLPRKIRGGYWCWQQHGTIYTFQLLIRKVAKLK